MNSPVRWGLCAWAQVVCLLIAAGTASAQSAPVVSSVTAAQRPDDSKLIDIYYDLADESLCTVWVLVSDDAGTTWCVPAETFYGQDFGPNVVPGAGKHIIWDAGADIPGKIGNLKVRVYADDGNGQARMALVPAGTYSSPNYAWTYVEVFWIDKYEVTNQRYCEFLNSADPTGAHWDSQMEITKTGSTYAVHAGQQNYPIRYVNLGDATAFATWLSAREGRSYRLPSEQEWEKAAAWDPSQQNFYTYGFHSDTISCPQCNYNYCVGAPTSVGQYGTSYYGCYDMSGNVWEWCNVPSGVIRGGSWGGDATSCRCAYRGTSTPSYRNYDIGFRLVLDSN